VNVTRDTIVDGRYRALKRLGAGGMAEVWCAEDEVLGRRVALKLLGGRYVEDPEFRERFRREAQSAAGLTHLVPRLDEEAEWATMLSGGEQQRVAFARALIARPAVLLLDEAVTTLEETEGRALYRMLAERLPDTIVISIGRPALLSTLHRRAIALDGMPASARGATRTIALPA